MERDHLTALALAPARAYREVLYRPAGDVATWVGRRYAVLARPGEPLPGGPEPGDVLLQAVSGAPGPRRLAVVTELSRPAPAQPARAARRLVRRTRAPGSGRGRRSTRCSARPEWSRRAGPGPPPSRPDTAAEPRAGPGAAGEPDPEPPPGRTRSRSPSRTRSRPPSRTRPARRWRAAAAGADPPATTVLGDELTEDDPGPWTGTPEQVDFRARVLAEQSPEPPREGRRAAGPDRAAARRRAGHLPYRARPDHLRPDWPATAEAAGRLLAAANADLAVAQQAGDPDAQRTVRLTATSGYRGSDYQRRLWLGYFATKYYNRTRSARAKIAAGPHSDAASGLHAAVQGRVVTVSADASRAPGYSNHQGGIALDLKQDRTPGNKITNDSDAAARCRWRLTWFHGWLRTHAADHGFRPIPTEEWHWEYRPGVTPASDLTDHRGGKLWTFASATLPNRVAVFVPKAALGRPDVDVLVFAHGLLDGCTRPKHRPGGARHRRAVPASAGSSTSPAGRSCWSCRCWTGATRAARWSSAAARSDGTRSASRRCSTRSSRRS